jgi:hypothetical protein
VATTNGGRLCKECYQQECKQIIASIPPITQAMEDILVASHAYDDWDDGWEAPAAMQAVYAHPNCRCVAETGETMTAQQLGEMLARVQAAGVHISMETHAEAIDVTAYGDQIMKFMPGPKHVSISFVVPPDFLLMDYAPVVEEPQLPARAIKVRAKETA